MAELLVRNLPDHIVEALRRRAAEHGRSLEAEHRIILEEVLCASHGGAQRPGGADFWERAAKLREELRGRTFTPSEDLIRQDRDER